MVAEISACARLCPEIHSRKAANLSPAPLGCHSCHFCTPHSLSKNAIIWGRRSSTGSVAAAVRHVMSCLYTVHVIRYMT